MVNLRAATALAVAAAILWGHIRPVGGWPSLLISLSSPKKWVPLDKSEGGVKDKSILSVFLAPFFCQRG